MDLASLTTEKRNEKTMHLDEMTPDEILTVMNEEDARVVSAVKAALPQISKTIAHTAASLRQGGRILYIGAGTSGRLGVLDAVECPPTFGVSDNTVVGIMAGGSAAFVKAKEGAEDDPQLGRADLIAAGLTKADTVIGLTASGRTPYVMGALQYANSVGCATAAISCNENAEVFSAADIPIELMTGPEILAGSTRLKAGTAEKMVLNMISTISMIEVGKVYGNLMVDMRQTNEKLACRAENIVMQVTGCSRETARHELAAAGGETKLAITRMLLGKDLDTARTRLALAHGKVRDALKIADASDGAEVVQKAISKQ